MLKSLLIMERNAAVFVTEISKKFTVIYFVSSGKFSFGDGVY